MPMPRSNASGREAVIGEADGEATIVEAGEGEAIVEAKRFKVIVVEAS